MSHDPPDGWKRYTGIKGFEGKPEPQNVAEFGGMELSEKKPLVLSYALWNHVLGPQKPSKIEVGTLSPTDPGPSKKVASLLRFLILSFFFSGP